MAECEGAAPWHAELAGLRERGAQRDDPVRFRLAEALARRAAAHGGAARRVIDAKLAALVGAMGDSAARRGPAPAEATSPRAAPARAPLADLLEHIARQRAVVPAQDAAHALAFFRRTWARLSAEQHLAQSREALPVNAGPLHSQHVVHAALIAMRALSPAYFERFVAHVDALLWLEQTNARPPSDPAAGARVRPPRRGAARRRPD